MAWLTLPGNSFRIEPCLVLLSVCASGAGLYVFSHKVPRLSLYSLLVTSTLSLVLALMFIVVSVVPYFAVLSVVANAVVSPTLGFTAVLLSTGAILMLSPQPASVLPIIAVLLETDV